MASGSKKVVIAALIGNGLISITKFAAAIYTGSSAMMSEGIHSLVDTGNQGLLLYGMGRAKRPADKKHPFGYGAEIYFWAFVVAIMIFAIGAGVSIYEGVEKVLHPHPVANPYVNYIVLIAAMCFEAVAWWVAFKEFRATKGSRGWIEAIRESKDPSLYTVLFEDTAAMLGLIIAFVGLVLAQITGAAWLDGAASIMIGVVLAGTAAILCIETKSLLVGEAASDDMIEAVRQIVEAEDGVIAMNEMRTLHRGPDDVLLAISVDFDNARTVHQLEETTYRLEIAIKKAHPSIKRLFIEAQSRERHNEMLTAEKDGAKAAADFAGGEDH